MLEKKYDFKISEEKWRQYWEKNKVYEFKKNDRKIFSIDTPPPTVSGKIHIGHIFSYTQAEIIARFKRLSGYNVFYPFGFDDNGLPSERLVEKEKDIKARDVSREEFNKLCYETTDKYEEEFKDLFSKMGVSTDWNLKYKTVSPRSTRISQLSFLDLVEKNKAYYKESPALWCNECGTSIAQAELETKTISTQFNYINYKTTDDITFTIATTRPELIPACVSIFINPDDEKNKHLIGKTAIIPIFNFEVPIMSDEKVAVDKGSSIVMCCTFGDQTDIEWWKKYNLPLKKIFTEDGRIISDISKYGGMKIKEARKQIIEDLKELNLIVKIDDLEHEVQTHERCGKEIEYAVIKQWFIDILNNKDKFLELANNMKWYPTHMKARYDEWVKNISWDWCISRQRFFGVPFPVWYCKSCGEPIFADKKSLPVNPLKDSPKTKCHCGSEEYIPENDVMDTWATSSVTPLINMKYKEKENFEDILNPMSLRCNAHDIIRTWDFYTIVKSFYHFDNLPWNNVMISGFVLADKGEKISKRKGNSKFEPFDLINEYSADVVRYWAASGRLGTDIIFSEETLQRGKKFINKLYNMASFVNMHLEDYKDKEFNNFEFFDRWIIGKYMDTEKVFMKYLEEYEIGLALNVLEKFFWSFCDNYIEIVKHRLYRPEEFKSGARYSGQKTIYILLYKLLQDFSIFFPFITEELFQNIYGNAKSIHITKFEELNYKFSNESENGEVLINLISEVRGFKTNKNVSLKTIIDNIKISLNQKYELIFNESIDDIKATLTIKNINLNVDDTVNFKISEIILEDNNL